MGVRDEVKTVECRLYCNEGYSTALGCGEIAPALIHIALTHTQLER